MWSSQFGRTFIFKETLCCIDVPHAAKRHWYYLRSKLSFFSSTKVVQNHERQCRKKSTVTAVTRCAYSSSADFIYIPLRVDLWLVVLPYLLQSLSTAEKNRFSIFIVLFCNFVHKNTISNKVRYKQWLFVVPSQPCPPFPALYDRWIISHHYVWLFISKNGFQMLQRMQCKRRHGRIFFRILSHSKTHFQIDSLYCIDEKPDVAATVLIFSCKELSSEYLSKFVDISQCGTWCFIKSG